MPTVLRNPVAGAPPRLAQRKSYGSGTSGNEALSSGIIRAIVRITKSSSGNDDNHHDCVSSSGRRRRPIESASVVGWEQRAHQNRKQ